MNHALKIFAFILSFIFAFLSLPSESVAKKHVNLKKEIVVSEDATIIKHPRTTFIALKSKQAIVVDFDSADILLEKNATERMVPSSMTKMMTSYLIEEKIKKSEISYDTEFLISEKAWRMAGSKTFVPLGEMVRSGDLLKGIIIQSGNDACVAAAEGLYGSEELFVDEMNKKAKEFGMKNTHFTNSSGWPDANHYSTAYDLAILSSEIIKDHMEFYPLYSEKSFTFGKDQKGRPITQGNRNTLLYKKDTGCDGIKTGHTEEGGFGIAASFLDNGKRYIMVVNGLSSMKERTYEALVLLHWVKQNFEHKKLYAKGDIVEKAAPVLFGVKDTIPLIVEEDVVILVPKSEQNNINIKIDFVNPIPAPFKKGDVLGKLIVTAEEKKYETGLTGGESVEKVGFLNRIKRFASYWILGK